MATFEERFGKEKAEEIKRRQRLAAKKRWDKSEEHEKASKGQLERFSHPEEMEKLIKVQNAPEVLKKKREANLGENNPMKKPVVREKNRKSHLGKKHSRETIKKMKVSQNQPEVAEKKRNKRKGLTWEEIFGFEKAIKAKENFIALRKGKTYAEIYGKDKTNALLEKISGSNHHWFRGSSNVNLYPAEFRESLKEKIRIRDNRVCQMCGKTEEENIQKLSIHHVDSNKENCNSKNLISLCRSCHGKVESGNPKHYLDFFNKILAGVQ